MTGFRVRSTGETFPSLAAVRAHLNGSGLGVSDHAFRLGVAPFCPARSVFDQMFGTPCDLVLEVTL